MKPTLRHLRNFILTITIGVFAASTAVFAFTMTPIPPNVATTPTSATVSWSTDSIPGPNHVWYGAGGPQWSSFAGLGGDVVNDIDMFNSTRGFLVTFCGVNCGHLYEGNRQAGGTFAWQLIKTTAYPLNTVAAEKYNIVWYAGNSSTVERFHVSDPTVTGSFSVAPMTVVWSIDESQGTVWAAGNGKNLVSYNIAAGGSAQTRITNLSTIDPAYSRYTVIEAYDSSHVWAVADTYVSASQDGGTNWVNWNPASGQNIEDLKTVSPTEAYAVGRAGWIYRMSGFAPATWTKQKITTNDFLSLGASTNTRLMAFGCCRTGTDYSSVSYDGTNWSDLQDLGTVADVLAADFVSPTSGVRGGGAVQHYMPLYSNVSTVAGLSLNQTVNLTTGLQGGVNYHALADTAWPNGGGGPDITEMVESGDFPIKTTGLDVTSGPTVTPLATTATIDWGTTIPADTRAYLSPVMDWDVRTNVAATTFNDVDAYGDFAVGVGSFGHVLAKTQNLSSTWTVPLSSPNVFEAVSLIGKIGWAVGDNSIYKTTDGINWSTQAAPFAFYLGVVAVDPLHAYAVGDIGSGKGVVVRTSDGGTTWEIVQNTPEVMYDVVVVDPQTIIAVGVIGKGYRSEDSGGSWMPVSLGTSNSITRASVANDLSIWAVGQIGTVIRSVDKGKTWSSGPSCTMNSLFGVDAESSNDIWFVGNIDTIFHWTSGNGCISESIPGVGVGTDLKGISISGGNIWVAGSNGLIARKGLDRSSPQFKTVIKDTATPVSSHTTGSISGLSPNTTYDYFIQSDDSSSGLSVVKSGTFTTLPVPTLEVSTNSLTFSMTEGGPNPASQTFQVRNQGGGNLGNWTASASVPWLTLGPTSGISTPGNVTVNVDGSGKTALASPYHWAVTVNADPGVANSPQTINVTLNVSTPPLLVLSSTLVDFGTVTQGDPLPQPIAVSVTNGTPLTTLKYTLSSTPPFLTVTSSGVSPYTTPNQIVFQPISTATVGTNFGIVTVTGVGTVTNSPQTITIKYQVDPGPVLDVSWPTKPAPITFTATQLGPDPAANTSVFVKNSGGGTMTWLGSSTVTWMDVTPSSGGNALTGLSIQAHTGALAPSGGTPYLGKIRINAGTAGSYDIPVEFTIVAAPVLSLTPLSLTFTTPQLTNPATQTVTITSGAPGPAGWTAAVTSGAWLSLTGATSGTTYSSIITASVDVTGLPVNDYNGNIRVSSAGAVPPFIDVPVTLHVTSPPVLSATPASPLIFDAVEGKNPDPQAIHLDNIGGVSTVMNWTITQPAETWIRLSTSSCSGLFPPSVTGSNPEGTPATDVNVCVDITSPSLLAAGPPYTSSFAIVSPGTSGAPKTYNVTLTVNPDTVPPVLTGVTITPGHDCAVNPPDIFAHVEWTTDEYSNSQVYWGETTTGSIPQYEQPAIIRDDVDIVLHDTGGVLTHDVLVDNLVGGHTYYMKIRSTDRYNNTSAFIDKDPPNSANYLKIDAPTSCDNDPPTNVTLTVPPDPLFGTVNVNLGAQDQSHVQKFEIIEGDDSTGTVLATATVPPGACTSIGPTYTCTVTYPFITNILTDGTHTIHARAYDIVGNPTLSTIFADSPDVTVTIDNAIPTVTNVLAEPTNPGTGWQAVISWDTDKESDSQVIYGMELTPGTFNIPGDYLPTIHHDISSCNDCMDGVTSINGVIKPRHRVLLEGLQGGQIYHFHISSCSKNNILLCGH